MRSLKELLKFKVHAEDGVFGHVSDFYFDDHGWNVRYLVIDTGGWLPGRKVLLSPTVAGVPDWLERSIPVELNRVQIENSPSISTDLPVSRQHEEAISLYYGWPRYWSAAGIPSPGLGGWPVDRPSEAALENAEEGVAFEEVREDQLHHDPNFRSLRAIMGYAMAATDGEIGHVDDLLADLDTWSILRLVVDTRNWLPGREVLVGIEHVSAISWEDRRVSVDLTKSRVESSPEFEKGSVFV